MKWLRVHSVLIKLKSREMTHVKLFWFMTSFTTTATTTRKSTRKKIDFIKKRKENVDESHWKNVRMQKKLLFIFILKCEIKFDTIAVCFYLISVSVLRWGVSKYFALCFFLNSHDKNFIGGDLKYFKPYLRSIYFSIFLLGMKGLRVFVGWGKMRLSLLLPKN